MLLEEVLPRAIHQTRTPYSKKRGNYRKDVPTSTRALVHIKLSLVLPPSNQAHLPGAACKPLHLRTPPSMRLVVKPLQAFFPLRPRRRGPSTPPGCLPVAGSCRSLAASLPRSAPAFFLRRRSPLTPCWGRAAAEKECSLTRGPLLCGTGEKPRSAGVITVQARTPGLPSIRVGPATLPSTCYLIRPLASGTPHREPTHRTNGAFAGSPGGITAALSDLSPPPSDGGYVRHQFLLDRSCRSQQLAVPQTTTTAAAAAFGVTPRRRIHAQTPVLLLGPLWQLALLQVIATRRSTASAPGPRCRLCAIRLLPGPKRRSYH